MPFKFSGHETFPCRYAWLPKAFSTLNTYPEAFANDEQAMVSLGIGKNMVRAIRFWVQATGIAVAVTPGNYAITEFGRAILSRDGLDPFLEDIRTLWLIHWQLSTRTEEPLFAWDYMLNRWHYPEISRTKAVEAFHKESEQLGRSLSVVTLEQHFDIFLHTYVPTRSKKGNVQEDNLDCPLVELELILKIGERKVDNSGNKEPLYAFRREEKPEITPALFIYCLDDYWMKYYPHEMTLPFHHISVAHGSPGQIFKLPESDILRRLHTIEEDSDGMFIYKESAYLPMVTRRGDSLRPNLSTIYENEVTYA